MIQMKNPLNEPLPRLRGDLEVYKGPDDADGTPTYNIHDPVTATYYKISWVEAEVINKLQKGLNVNQLIKELEAGTTLRLTVDDVFQFVKQLQMQGLLEERHQAAALEEKYKQSKPNWLKWLVFNYLFFRIPLFQPDQFLRRTLSLVSPLMTTTAVIIYGIVILIGLGVMVVNWSEFIHTFTYFFNVQGIIIYSLVIIATKCLHELGHAYTSKKYGVHVRSMGVAILLLFPMLYTDATDAWKLSDRWKRFIISSAGIVVESFLAGLCTILWSISNPGLLQSLFFVVASVNWVSTLILNLNPAMRFDGYYILGDLLGIDNLHPRAFNVLRTKFYRAVAGADLPPAEPKLTDFQRNLLLGLAIYTWIYRLFLYTAIALFVYYKFTKALGIALFILEIGIFFVWPVVYEFQYVQQIRDKIKLNYRLKIVAATLIIFLIWFILPWPIKASSPAITIPEANQILLAPLEGAVKKLYITRGQNVTKGTPIINIESTELQNQINILQKEIAILEKKLEIAQLSDTNLPFFTEIQTQLIQKRAELEGFQQKQELNILKAKVDGVVYEWDEWVREGQPIKQNQRLGQIGKLEDMYVIAYVEESEVDYLQEGQRVTFFTQSLQGNFTGHVVQVSPVRAQVLPFDQLSSGYGGDIPVNQDKEMIESYYLVQVRLENPEQLHFGMTGWIRFWGPWRSRAFVFFNHIFAVLLRESGL